MGLLDFFSNEAGQRRRAALDEWASGAEQYVPPNLRPLVGLLAEATPSATLDRAAMAGGRAFGPNATPMQRVGAVGDMLSETAGIAAPMAVASRAGMPAAQAVQEGLLGFSVGANNAMRGAQAEGLRFLDDEFGGAGLDFFKMPDQDGILREAQERTRASTPGSWLDPKFERGFHPASNTKLGDVNVAPIFDDRGTLADVNALNFEDLLGTTLTPAYGDRTRAGGLLRGFNDVEFDPVEMHGGQAFMREAGTGAWASEAGPMTAKAKTVQRLIDEGEDPRLIYTAMGAQSGDFSQMMADSITGQLKGAKITKKARKAFDDRMFALIGDKWPGIDSPDAIDRLPGSTRWAVWQEMDRAKWRDQGFPDVGRTRLALTDPQLIDADPFDTGLAVSKPGGLLSDPEVAHPTYSTQISGEYLGDTEMLPGPLIWRDFFSARRAAGASPASDQRSFMMNSPTITQKVDQQMVDEVAAYLEALRQAGVQTPQSQAAQASGFGANTLLPSSARGLP